MQDEEVVMCPQQLPSNAIEATQHFMRASLPLLYTTKAVIAARHQHSLRSATRDTGAKMPAFNHRGGTDLILPGRGMSLSLKSRSKANKIAPEVSGENCCR